MSRDLTINGRLRLTQHIHHQHLAYPAHGMTMTSSGARRDAVTAPVSPKDTQANSKRGRLCRAYPEVTVTVSWQTPTSNLPYSSRASFSGQRQNARKIFHCGCRLRSTQQFTEGESGSFFLDN